MDLNKASRNLKLFAVAGAIILGSSISSAADEAQAKKLATLFRSSRAVITENIKKMKTNPKEAGLSMKKAKKRTGKIYLSQTGSKLEANDEPTKNLLSAIDSVFEKAFADGYASKWAYAAHYPNKLLPARFAREVGEKLKEVSSGKYHIRLTTSPECIVNAENSPDNWETNVIKTKLSQKSWKRDAGFSETVGGKFRYILPEYYSKGCLNCHGGAKGKAIHPACKDTEVGAFGGAISISMKN